MPDPGARPWDVLEVVPSWHARSSCPHGGCPRCVVRPAPHPVLPGDVIDEVTAERLRQEAKFPNQHLGDYTDGPSMRGRLRPIVAADEAREIVELHVAGDRLSWSDVLVEEVAEAIDEAQAGDVAALRAELIQVAAVALRWIADLAHRQHSEARA